MLFSVLENAIKILSGSLKGLSVMLAIKNVNKHEVSVKD